MYVARATGSACRAATSLREVDPTTEQTLRSPSCSGPMARSSPLRTSSCWPATKYGPAWPTSALRSGVMEYDAMTRSTRPLRR